MRWLSKDIPNKELSSIQVTMFLGLNNLRNIEAMNLMFLFFEDAENLM